MASVLIIAGLVCFAGGSAFDLAMGIARRSLRSAPYLLAALGSVLLAVAGVLGIGGSATSVSASAVLSAGHGALRLDSLAGLFLVITSGVAAFVSLAFSAWAVPEGRITRRGLGALCNTILGSVALIVLANDAFVFLFAWEALAVCFYLLVGFERDRQGRSEGAYATLIVAKVGGAALLVAFLLLAARAHSLSFAEWGSVPPSTLLSIAYALIVAGCAAKVGMAPLQAWMPGGYAAAPGPARAIMSGVAMNVGVYTLWRFLDILARPPEWLAMIVLVLGAITALLGILHAAVQSRLNRVIAYSSVENGGIIMSAYGVALAGAAVGAPALLAVGLLAGTLHVISHAIAKSALFLAGADAESEVGSDDLEKLRDLGRRRPLTSITFGLGALTLAALPPTIGFASEWFIFEALMQQFRLSGVLLRLCMALAGALLALAAGIAALTFARLMGLIFAGRGRIPEDAVRTSSPAESWHCKLRWNVGTLTLSAACLALAAFSPLEIRFLAKGLASIVPQTATLRSLASPLVLQPGYPDFSILSPTWFLIAFTALLVTVSGATLALSRGSLLHPRRVAPWTSASEGLPRQSEYSAFGYANVLRHVLGTPLGAQRSVAEAGDEEGEAQLVYRSDVVEVTERYLYLPLRRSLVPVVDKAKLIQSGRLASYLAYMLIALVALIAIVSALN